MRVAFFSPLPPAKSGIADYAAALLDPLSRRAEVESFTSLSGSFDASRFDVAVYQLGNNPYHTFAYEAALHHPGVVVMHESNLHHLIADLYIRRGNWDQYLREVEFDAGQAALDYAARYVRTLERGPDYDGVPMLRRVLARSRAAIVHSASVEAALRNAGFAGPVAKIPHGSWILNPDRMGYRHRLGLDETTSLIGIFGFLKPYKRIAESLRAFRRLVRLEPRARMILVGEVHPELPLASMIASLGLSATVRSLGFTSIEDFNGYLAACDVVLNLRYPTVGESSGALLRALGMGKAVVVSDVGSFRELPDNICLKAPVDISEEDHLFEYLNLFVSRPEVARSMGAHARRWVERECNWELVAERYAAFLETVVAGREWEEGGAQQPEPQTETAPETAPAPEPVPEEYVLSWAAPVDGSREYIESHIARLTKTLEITPPGGPDDRILEMGAYLHITPALKTKLGYGEVRGCYYGPAGNSHTSQTTSEEGETFECVIDLFNAEKDRFPYEDGYFSTVLCCELIEHLFEDPMFLMAEVNRILKSGGHLVLTTPNIVSIRALAGILQGYHPMLFPAYIKPNPDGDVDARHNREYTPREIGALLENSGFEVVRLETGPFREESKPEHRWVEHVLERYMLTPDLRGDGIYAVGRKRDAIRDRYPSWLYS